ncbi:T9SS type A sorting domain-containing protein [bacterium]|nr:T9SS type A sorting domain-containing protein [bacterium]
METFRIVRYVDPDHEVLIVHDGTEVIEEVLTHYVDDNNISAEIWDMDFREGIDRESLIGGNWNTVLYFAWGSELPTREWEDSPFAAVIEEGMNFVFSDMDYLYANGEDEFPEFGAGDFAFDVFGVTGAVNDPAPTDSIFVGNVNDVLTWNFADTPYITYPYLLGEWSDFITNYEPDVIPFFRGEELWNEQAIRRTVNGQKFIYFAFDPLCAAENLEFNNYFPTEQAVTLLDNILEWMNPTEQPEPHFEPVVPTGIPYSIVVDEATFRGQPIDILDEIAVFDGNLCVGAEVVFGELPLVLTAYEQDPMNPFELPGFVEGNPIIYKFWLDGEELEVSAFALEYVDGHGDGFFGTFPFTEVRLSESPEQYFDPVDPTGIWYAFIVNEATFEGEALEQFDEIAVFDSDLCVGATTVIGEWPIAFSAVGSDPAGLPGYEPGNPILYKFWIHGEEVEVPAVALEYVDGHGDGIFGTLPYAEVRLSAEETLTVPLEGNYFELISTNLIPPDLDAVEVFGGVGNLVITYQNNGSVFIPGQNPINTIGDIDVTQAYRIFCDQDDDIIFRGGQMELDTEYDLVANQWNWIGHPFDIARNIVEAFAPIRDFILIVQTDDGGVYLPQLFDLNTIGETGEGEGYFVFVSEDVTFEYPLDDPDVTAHTSIISEPPQPVEGTVEATGLPYVVLISTDNVPADQNIALIKVFDGDLLVGSAVVDGDADAIPVITWGTLPGYDIPGFVEGHRIRVEVYDSEGTRLGSQNADRKFGEGPYANASITATDLIPGQFAVEGAYPNPFNPSVTVPFALPENGMVTISLYNVLGQRTYQLSQKYDAGHHKFLLAAKSTNLVSGLYFLTFEFEGQKNTQKIMLLK